MTGPFISVAQDGDVSMVQGAMSTANGSASGLALDPIGTSVPMLKSTSSSIALGSVGVTIPDGVSATGGLNALATATESGNINGNVNTFSIIYTATQGAATLLPSGGSAWGSGYALATAGGSSIEVIDDPAATWPNTAPQINTNGITGDIYTGSGAILAITPTIGNLAVTSVAASSYGGDARPGDQISSGGAAAAAAFIVEIPITSTSSSSNAAATSFISNSLITSNLTSSTIEFGDVNLDFSLDADDIDELFWFATRQSGTPVFRHETSLGWSNGANVLYDVNLDTILDEQDIDALIHDRFGTEYGDANLDGSVDDLDEAILFSNAFTYGGWADGDFDGNGFIDPEDLDIFEEHYGFGTSTSQATAVPEPTTAISLIIACLGSIRKRPIR